MDRLATAQAYLEQFIFSLSSLPRGWRFFWEHRLWKGFWRYGWVARFLVIVGMIVGLQLLSIVWESLSKIELASAQQMLGSLSMVSLEIAKKEFGFLFQGGMRYILLILMEILIFHVLTRTVNQLTGEHYQPSARDFVQAEVRMIKVGLYSWILDSVFTGVIKTVGGIFGLWEFIELGLIFFLQSYFMGFTVLDNYFEQYGLTVKESVKRARWFAGVALAMGLTLRVCFLVPIVGAIAGPILAGVTVALVMHELDSVHREQDRNSEWEDPAGAVETV